MAFSEIITADKSERVRAWSIETAIDSLTYGDNITSESIVRRASLIEDFVLNGSKETTSG